MIASEDQIKKQLLFIPCQTKEHLRLWIKSYLELDYDFNIICDDEERHPPSNSTPLDLLWELYSAAMDGKDPSKTFYLAYAARDSYKTLSCAVFEVLCLFHLRRDIAHLAAVESQASNCKKYVEDFLKKPILREYSTGNNKRNIEVTRYEHKTSGAILSPAEWQALDDKMKDNFREVTHFLRVIVATMSGTNSLHCSMLILDELDLAPPKPVEEAKMIAAPGKERGELPITFMTSTRKFNYGLVQKAIDDADKSGLHIRHWNLIDITSKCPTSRHRPDLPMETVYVSEENLKTYSEEQYVDLSEATQEKLYQAQAYAGCVRNCKLFAMCRGRLATKQTSTSTLLKTVDHVQSVFAKVEVETAKAQLLTWKPSTAGLVYPKFQKDIHMVSAHQMAEKITGDTLPKEITKSDLVQIMRQHGVQFYSGHDYGYSHAFATVTGGVYGATLFIIDAFEIPGLEISDKLNVCDQRIKDLEPIIYADVAYPADIKTFRKHGYKMRDWTKEKNSVKEGIDCVRLKLAPFAGEPQIYLLKDDEGCQLLSKRMSEYHWKIDAAGRITDIPDDSDDDICDALRYLVMNVFPIKKGKLLVGHSQERQAVPAGHLPAQNWMEKVIQDHLHQPDTIDSSDASGVEARGQKGRLVWNM